MTRRKTARVRVDGEVVIVSGWKVGDVLAGAGLKPVFVGSVRGWTLDRRRAGDVVAALENARYDVRVEQPVPPVVSARVPAAPRTDQQAALW